MSEGREWKSVNLTPPAPYDYLDVTVEHYSPFEGPEHTVHVKDVRYGRGVRRNIDLAEAEALATLKAIRAYRRKNRALIEAKGSGE